MLETRYKCTTIGCSFLASGSDMTTALAARQEAEDHLAANQSHEVAVSMGWSA